jgi:S-adenosylmethionine hydrolase
VGNYSIDEGAFHMARSVPYFPEGTVHIGVVDPGVGSERRGIIIQSKGAYLVGPDNGLLAPAAERLGVEKVYRILNGSLLPERVSDVFDGRDVFGPTGALLARGVPPWELGEELGNYIRLPFYELKVEGSSVEATVIHVDGFGNVVTNVTYDALERMGVSENAEIEVRYPGGDRVLPYVRSFSAVPRGDLLLLAAGGGYCSTRLPSAASQHSRR